jgi:hypothetical protein
LLTCLHVWSAEWNKNKSFFSFLVSINVYTGYPEKAVLHWICITDWRDLYNNDMSSSSLSSTQYHLLTCNINENQIMEQHHEKQKNDYSSSAPTIISSNDLICESKRWELYLLFMYNIRQMRMRISCSIMAFSCLLWSFANSVVVYTSIM